jgi:hypothetical protein
MLKSNCPNCGNERTYRTRQGWLKGLTKNCKSCANSLSQGGTADGMCASGCGRPKSPQKYIKSYCEECFRTYCTRNQREFRYRKYGVTHDWYVKEAAKGCAICKTPLDPNSPNKLDHGHIDHDHRTGKARGVLCNLCNKGLGLFKDSPASLRIAAEYLEIHKEK